MCLKLCELSKKNHLRGAAWMEGLPGLGQTKKEKILTQEKISSHKKEQLDTLRKKFKNLLS